MKEFSGRFVKPVIVPVDQKVDLTVSGVVSEVDGKQIKIELSASSAGVTVLGMSKAVVVK